MNKFSRISIAIISLSLLIAFFVPVWKIDLEAPQYPEGLGMKIWINKLSGDINTINGLNHYIGMQFIVEDSIPELKYMPYLLGFLMAMGIVVSLTKKKGLLYTWVCLFVLLGIAGGIDFYLWEYDYGHNLDPRAAIKVEGMTYQPPLWGSKELLNFVAHSYPDAGGWVILISGFFAVGLMMYNIFEKKKITLSNTDNSVLGTYIKSFNILLLFGSLFLFSCEIKPQPLSYGVDHCDHCKMGIADKKFGAELVTPKGKVYKFDAIECMVNFADDKGIDSVKGIEHFLVADASNPGNLVNAYEAYYLFSEGLPSPMGANISAYGSQDELENFKKEYDGEVLKWKEVKNTILSK